MNKARGKSGPVSTFSNLLLFKFVVCSYFPFLVFLIKSGVGGGGVLLVVLPTFQLVTELTEEKNKR